MKDIILREFNSTLDDAKELKRIDRLTFNDCKYNEQEIISISRKSDNKIFLAEYRNVVVGFISLLQVRTLHYHGLWVDLIAVDPSYQKAGIGKKLLEYAIRYGKEVNINIVSGLVATNNYASKKIFENQEFSKSDKDFHLYMHDEK